MKPKVDDLRNMAASATSLWVLIPYYVQVSVFRLPDTVLGVVSDYAIYLLVVIQFSSSTCDNLMFFLV